MDLTPVALKAITLTPTLNSGMHIDMTTVTALGNDPNALLFDVREPDEYNEIDKVNKVRAICRERFLCTLKKCRLQMARIHFVLF